MPEPSPGLALGILLLSGAFRRAHYALVLAAAAAAMDRRVTLFAADAGLHALCRDWSGLDNSEDDAVLRGRGVAGFGTLRDTLVPLGVRLLACEAALRAMALSADHLLPEVERAGVPTFLAAVGQGQMLSI